MKRKNVKWISIFMVIAMIIVMTAACGGKEEKKDSDREEVTEETATEEETEADDAQTEAPAEELTEEQKVAQAERDEINRYAEEELGIDVDSGYDAVAILGIPEEKMQELYNSVKNAVSEEYLAKYGISASSFAWPGNNGGKGDPAPWMYLQEKIGGKMFSLDSPDDPAIDPSEYYMTDPQMVELMDCVYRSIIGWIQSNNYTSIPPVVLWDKVIIPNVTFE